MTDEFSDPVVEEPEALANELELEEKLPEPVISQAEPVVNQPEPAIGVQKPVKPVKPKKALSFSAVISFIFGIGTFVWFFTMVSEKPVLTYITTLVIALIAVFTGHQAKHQIRTNAPAVNVKGKHIANFGLMLGYLFLLFAVFIVALDLMGIVTVKGLFGA